MADELDNKVDQPEAPEVPTEQPADLEPEEQALTEPNPEPEAPEAPETPPEDPAEPATQEQPPISRRAAKRLEKLEGLVQRLRGPQQQPQPQQNQQGIDYRNMIEADDQVYQQLESASQQFGQTQFNAGLQQAESVRFHTRLEIDAPRIESKYPQFDKSSPEFNPGLANSVNEWFLATVGYDAQTDTVRNGNVRYADFVEGVMELADALAGEKTARTTQNIARQASNAGLRPDGSSAKPLNLNKAPEDMSDEELKAAVSATMPRDGRGRFVSH